jgi:hypothetical protein
MPQLHNGVGQEWKSRYAMPRPSIDLGCNGRLSDEGSLLGHRSLLYAGSAEQMGDAIAVPYRAMPLGSTGMNWRPGGSAIQI